MVPSERTVTVARRPRQEGRAAHRRLAAPAATYAAPRRSTSWPTFDKLNPWYYSRRAEDRAAAARHRAPHVDLRRGGQGGLDETNALFEARRCLSCGNCFECDNCYGVCPDNAVIKLGPGKRFEFNYDYCKGCGICVAECPCGAIKMVPETSEQPPAGGHGPRQADDAQQEETACRRHRPHGRSRRSVPAWFPRGVALLRDPTLNKGTAFTDAERDALGTARPAAAARADAGGAGRRASWRTSAASRTTSRSTSTSRRCTTATRRCSSGSSSTTRTR